MTLPENKYNELESPKVSLKDIKDTLKFADKFTLWQIIEYLKIDSFEIVKNLAKVTNSGNASEIIAYRDGALSRNQALIDLLSERTAQKDTYIDRKLGLEKIKK